MGSDSYETFEEAGGPSTGKGSDKKDSDSIKTIGTPEKPDGSVPRPGK